MVKNQNSQRGAALLLFLFLALGVGATLFLSAWNINRAHQERERKTLLALQQAKEALIGDAAVYKSSSTLPGHLRCPEVLSAGSPVEGQAQSSCASTASRLGRFPWRTLKTDNLVDGDGEPLWYALSTGFSSKPINNNSIGQIQVDGIPNAAVAIIIAPGAPLSSQNRSQPSASNPPQPTDYLDLGNAAGSAFISNGPPASFNDRVITISHAELFRAVNARVLAEIRGLDDTGLPVNGLRRYYNDNGQFPWAALPGGGPAIPNTATGGLPINDLTFDSNTLGWLNDNNWPSRVTYTRLSANTAQISIGSSVMKVLPCTALPCP